VLQITDPRERLLVRLADAGLRLATAWRPRRTRPDARAVGRILVLRLERIGDLVMSLPALHALRAHAPDADIDLVVGSWNAPLASLLAGVTRVQAMDAPWLSRGRGGGTAFTLARRAWLWRARRYDVAINLEGDIRSNMLLGLSGARWKAGFGMAGGGPLLDQVVAFDPRGHIATNGVRLVDAVFGVPPPSVAVAVGAREAAGRLPRAAIVLPPSALAEADALLGMAGATTPNRALVGIHVGAGRPIKEWPVARLAAVAARLAAEREITIVLTGSDDDRAAADQLRAALRAPVRVVDLVGRLDVVGLGAVLTRLALLITPDTGPMHLAGVLGTPLVAIFGPSSPERWGPLSDMCRVVRVDLPCSPCNRIRTPPARCQGHTPDCLASISVDDVHGAAVEVLARTLHEVR
jgi:ADP-heptose:LPS heptosyltransferase